jgi:hypothetical protein
VRREVLKHMRENAAARRARHPKSVRILRRFFANHSFCQFVGVYVVLNLVVIAAELVSAQFFPEILPAWTGLSSPDIKALLTNTASYLITAQVGVLGVISIAVGLVTLIGQREGSGTDVRLYYYESLAFEVVASSIALLAVLCAQLVWPFQFLLHRLGEGTSLQFFKLVLLCFHIVWLLLNLAGLAHFVATTFRFVQQPEREKLRERYIANFILPIEMKERLRQQLYLAAGSDLILTTRTDGDNKDGMPEVYFGLDLGKPEHIEIESTFSEPTALHDVRMLWVAWAVRRWSQRCIKGSSLKPARLHSDIDLDTPVLSFPVHLDYAVNGKTILCRRQQGVPLDRLERFILRRAFGFRRTTDEA